VFLNNNKEGYVWNFEGLHLDLYKLTDLEGKGS